MTLDFLAQAQALHESLVARRRDFHRHPELAYEEVRTAGIVAEVLRTLDLEVQTGVGKTGVVGLLEGADDGPTVMVRADMDALPIQEQSEKDYASTIPGKMHACGHDGHTAAALGVAEMLAAHRDRIAGRVKFVFQPAEEGDNGSVAMIEDGVLQNPAPDVALGLHFWSGLEAGKVAAGAGPVMAGADIVHIRIQGAGGHGAMPHQTHDPIAAAAQIVVALQSVVGRSIDPLDTAVLSICEIHAGDAFNVIPDSARLSGTLRTYKPKVRKRLVERFRAITGGVAEAMECSAEIDIEQTTLPVCNDAGVTERVARAVGKALGESKLVEAVRTMGAEDMSYFLERVPGCFFFVGSGGPGADFPHHHPRFDLNEDALPVAAAAMAATVADYVISE